jgi:nucleoid DNA-binding protein
MTGVPLPQNLLARRIAARLKETMVRGASNYEPEWTSSLVQRVLGVTAEIILDAVMHGEEVQLGRLGHFQAKIYEERIVAANIVNGEKKVIPRRAKIEFSPLPSTETKMKEFSDFLDAVERHTMKVGK